MESIFNGGGMGANSLDPNYGYEQKAMAIQQSGQRMTMAGRIQMAVLEAEKKLADVKRAKEILDKNPELEELLNIMQRSHF